MSAVAHPSPLTGPRDGGVAARRAIVRWAGRLFRREWRQQLLLLTLLTVAVAAAIGSITVAHNTVPASRRTIRLTGLRQEPRVPRVWVVRNSVAATGEAVDHPVPDDARSVVAFSINPMCVAATGQANRTRASAGTA